MVDKKHWIQKAVHKEHIGDCTPMTKSTCTPRRKALAMAFKKHRGFHDKKEYGGEINNSKRTQSLYRVEQAVGNPKTEKGAAAITNGINPGIANFGKMGEILKFKVLTGKKK